MGELRSANRTHAPDLERTAENQRPKTGDWAETKLYRYDGTDLYQWFGRRVEGICRSPSVFWTACDEPFVIESTRPRTEGRGDEPVAWAYEYTNHLKGDRAPGGWLRAVAFEAPSRARVNAGFARNVQPLYASPIREPEISREAVIEAIRQHVKTRYERRERHGIYHFSGLEAAADAILNLAPVGGRGDV